MSTSSELETKILEDFLHYFLPDGLLDYFEPVMAEDKEHQIKQGNEGGSIRLDVYFNKVEGIAYAQLYDFYNYTYEPATGIVELKGDRAGKLISLL